jgi:predicted RNase H-related nuclease YkuK (DUF458 family)
MLQDLQFKKFGGDFISDLGQYIRDYLEKFPDTSIYVGCDSDNRRNHTMYAITVCMYDTKRKDGVHYIFTREQTPKERSIFNRMLGEVQRSINVAEYLEKELEGHIKRFTAEELMKMRDENNNLYKGHQDKLVVIDIDINPFSGNGHNKSNQAFEAARGWVVGSGFRCRFKPYSMAANSAADLICKRW